MVNGTNQNENALLQAIERLRQSIAGLAGNFLGGIGGTQSQSGTQQFSVTQTITKAFSDALKKAFSQLSSQNQNQQQTYQNNNYSPGFFSRLFGKNSGSPSGTPFAPGQNSNQSTLPSLRSQAGSITGNIFGKLSSHIIESLPAFGKLRNEVLSTTEFFRKFRQSKATAAQLATTSPLGEVGLQKLREFAKNPFLRPSQRHQIETQVDLATFQARQAAKLQKIAVRAQADTAQAGEEYRESLTAESTASNILKRRQVQQARAFRARDSIYQQYRHMLNQHMGYTAGTSPYGPHLAALRARHRQASRVANRTATQYRKAAQTFRAAQANVATRYQNFRSVANRGAAAKVAARGAAQAARSTAQTAQSTAAAAAGSVAVRALGAAAGSAVAGLSLMVSSISAARSSLLSFAESTNENNREFQAYSGKLSQAFARLEFGNIRRNFAIAGGTENTSTALVDAINRMRDNQVELNISIRNIANTSAILTAGAVGGFDKSLGKLTSQINRIIQGSGIGGAGGVIESLTEKFTDQLLLPLQALVDLVAWFFPAVKGDPGKMLPADALANQWAKNAADRGAGIRDPRGPLPGFGEIGKGPRRHGP